MSACHCCSSSSQNLLFLLPHLLLPGARGTRGAASSPPTRGQTQERMETMEQAALQMILLRGRALNQEHSDSFLDEHVLSELSTCKIIRFDARQQHRNTKSGLILLRFIGKSPLISLNS